MKGVFYPEYVKRLHGTHIKEAEKTKAEMVEAPPRRYSQIHQADNGLVAARSRCGADRRRSTFETSEGPREHRSRPSRRACLTNDSQHLELRRCTRGRVMKEQRRHSRTARRTLCVDSPGRCWQLARRSTPHPHQREGFQDRSDAHEDHRSRRGSRRACWACRGWFSTNILGNRDGEVLDDPENFKTKEVSKLGVLELHPAPADLHPDLYGDLYSQGAHRVLPAPRRPEGGLGQPRYLRVARLSDADQDRLSLSSDSILAAPIVLDLALFMDLAAQRAGFHGTQEWLSILLQEPDDGAGPVPGARSVHPADEDEEHVALDEGRAARHAPGQRILRLSHARARGPTSETRQKPRLLGHVASVGHAASAEDSVGARLARRHLASPPVHTRSTETSRKHCTEDPLRKAAEC